MEPAPPTFQQALGIEHARLWMLVRADIAALRQLVDESRQLIEATLHSREIGAALPPPPTRDTST
jgi:hypothetical protein